ncbi:BlaI/MecI/CopY family transcriptional regulator [Pantanalinema sp. GBBB05]|uniref:BlaI/MecI/CopY family transcriptional regulator n=1 Tax=Pantanalinema sp. GBBB05 TaxID=2604139 RepID=UPI001E12F166|nr:CopY family transcriptional regulator [Pantanalinema sp. GBBB05]
MVSLPHHRPRQLSLGPLETEILHILWTLNTASVKDVHEQILADPDRELAYTSVTTVLNRLTKKGWLTREKHGRSFIWRPLVTRPEAQALLAYEQLNQFLAIGNPDVVAAFADHLDQASVEQLEAIAQRLQAVRRSREEEQ